eukprot:COSAG01_NODE_57947_length_309_cov_0.728571_1_plen_99_part_01
MHFENVITTVSISVAGESLKMELVLIYISVWLTRGVQLRWERQAQLFVIFIMGAPPNVFRKLSFALRPSLGFFVLVSRVIPEIFLLICQLFWQTVCCEF